MNRAWNPNCINFANTSFDADWQLELFVSVATDVSIWLVTSQCRCTASWVLHELYHFILKCANR